MPRSNSALNRNVYIGIDPGKSGGLCVLNDEGILSISKMPETEGDVWATIYGWSPTSIACREILNPSPKVYAMIEQVGGYIGGKATPGSAMFNFGMGYGGLRMALIAAGIPFEPVQPQKWQKGLGISPRRRTGPGAETDSKWKNRLKARAQQLFPRVELTLAVADALLIAEYCRRKWKGII